MIAHERIRRRQRLAARSIAFYERGLARIEDRWRGTGETGERFRDSAHVYAEDLDIFGRGSLFELLSIARTGTGEAVLARWLLGPAEIGVAIERQQAVDELRSRLDLREEIALLGEDVRADVHPEALARWGEARPIPLPAPDLTISPRSGLIQRSVTERTPLPCSTTEPATGC